MTSQLEWCQLSGDNCNRRIVVSVEWRSRYNDGGAWICLLRQSIAIKLRLCLGLRETVLVILRKSYLLQAWPSIYRDQEVPIVVNSHDSVRPGKTINHKCEYEKKLHLCENVGWILIPDKLSLSSCPLRRKKVTNRRRNHPFQGRGDLSSGGAPTALFFL